MSASPAGWRGRAGLLAVAALLLLTGTAAADPLQFWLPTNVVARVHGKWGVALGIESRWEQDEAEPTRILIRPALIHEPKPGLSLWFGYGDTEVLPAAQRDDQQLWQQVLYSFHLRGWTVAPRVRVEERWVERSAGTSLRARTQIRLMHPLPYFSRWTGFASHESFLPLNDVTGVQSAGYGEGRFLVGLQRRVLPHTTVEPGFLWKFNNRPAPVKDTWNRAISVGVTVRY